MTAKESERRERRTALKRCERAPRSATEEEGEGREEGNVSWMRLCQSVTASADIALFVGGRGEEKGFVDGGGAKVKEEEEVSRGTCTSGAQTFLRVSGLK